MPIKQIKKRRQTNFEKQFNNESELKLYVRDLLNKYDFMHFHNIVNQGRYCTKGVSDLLGCVNGRFVALEFKHTEESRIRPEQIIYMNEVKKAGGIAYVIHKDNYEQIINELLDL